MNYSDKLRTMADYLDKHPEIQAQLTSWDCPHLYVSVADAEDFGRICRSLGDFRKGGYPGTLEAIVEVNEDTDTKTESIWRLDVSHSGSCERIPTGKTKVIPASEAREVPEYEYRCPDSWLSL